MSTHQSAHQNVHIIPHLSQSNPSGVPSRLVEEALSIKLKTLTNQTLPDFTERLNRSVDRHDSQLPILPPEITRDVFNKAIVELQEYLGEYHVVVNDRELDDGWYMEHP